MEISFCSHPNNNIVIATIFGTWHDSWAVVVCAKFCRDMITSNWIKAKWNFHRIWIVMEKSLVKWVPDQRWSKLFTFWAAVDILNGHYNNIAWGSWHIKSPVIRRFVQQLVQSNNRCHIIVIPSEGNHWWPVDTPHNGTKCGKRFHIMTSLYPTCVSGQIANAQAGMCVTLTLIIR